MPVAFQMALAIVSLATPGVGLNWTTELSTGRPVPMGMGIQPIPWRAATGICLNCQVISKVPMGQVGGLMAEAVVVAVAEPQITRWSVSPNNGGRMSRVVSAVLEYPRLRTP